MAKSAVIKARVEPELKQQAEAIFRALGLTPTEAVTLFYKQVTFQNGLPFDVTLNELDESELLTKEHPLERFFGMWADDSAYGEATMQMIREERAAYYASTESPFEN